MRRLFESACSHNRFPGVAAGVNFPLKEHKDLTDPAEIEQAIKLGEFIRNGNVSIFPSGFRPGKLIGSFQETLALYSLRKYRHLKRAYPSDIKPE
jgi:hypothetical protein